MKKMIFAPRTWVILILALLVFSGLFAMQWYGKQMMNEFFDNMPPPDVFVSSAEAYEVEWVPKVEVAAGLVAVNGANLTTEVGGIVHEIHYPNGANVKAGDLLISLFAETDRAELDALKATAKLAEIELERAQTLLERRNLSQSEYDRRRTELDQAKANVAAQEARLAQKELRAPFDGQLGIRRVNIGQYIAAGDPLISLQGLDPLYVNFSLPEQYNAQIDTGLPTQITVASSSEAPVAGEITAIAPEVDAVTRNFEVQATIRNTAGTLRPGMFARVEVPLGQAEPVTVVPQSAVSFRSYGTFVYILTPEEPGAPFTDDTVYQVTQRFVTLGATLGDLVAVSNVQPGETVASSGLLKLQPGGLTRINNTVTPGGELTPQPPQG